MDKKEALRKAAALCSGKEKCVKDIKDKLKQWHVDESEYDFIIDYLCDNNYIDEKRYAQAFVNDKFRFNKWGNQKIRYALREKQINERLIDDALNQINEAEYLDEMLKIIEKKSLAIKDTDSNKVKTKLFRFAISRGIESDYANKIVTQIINDNYV